MLIYRKSGVLVSLGERKTKRALFTRISLAWRFSSCNLAHVADEYFVTHHKPELCEKKKKRREREREEKESPLTRARALSNGDKRPARSLTSLIIHPFYRSRESGRSYLDG